MYRKRKDIFLKKSTVIVTASAMAAAAFVPVMAEGMTYGDRERAELKAQCEALVKDWDAELTQAQESGNNGTADFTLTLDEAGRSMIGMMAGMDVSWLENIGLNMDVSVVDSKEAIKTDLLLNDSEIGTMYVLIDLLAEMEYIQIPELSESWLKAALNVDMDVNGEAVSPDSMGTITGLASDPALLLPEGAVAAELLERYGNIVIDHMQEGPSVEETVSIDGISEDCTLLEGQIFQEDANEMAKELLTTAQSDEQLKELLTKWSEAMPEAGDLNAQFQSFAEEALADLEAPEGETEEAAADQYIVSRIWVNGDDKIVGRELAVCEGVETDTAFTWKTSGNGDASGLLFDVQSEDGGFTFSGSCQNTDGMKNGNYSVAIDGITVMEIAMENYDAAAAEEGYPSGTYIITFPQGESEEAYNPLSLFSMVLNLDCSKEDDSVNLNLEILSSGARLGDLNIAINNGGEEVGIPSEEDMAVLYDVMNEADMEAYSAEMSFDTILANAKSAGVPEELLTVIEQSIEAAMTGEAVEMPAEASVDEGV